MLKSVKFMYQKLCLLIIICLIMQSAIAVSAGTLGTTVEINGITKDSSTQMITVSGSVTPVAARQRVTLRIVTPEASLVDPTLFNYVHQANADSNGVFQFSFVMKSGSPSGVYKVLIGGNGIDVAGEREFIYFDPIEVEETFDILNTKSDAQAIEDFIFTGFNKEMLNIDLTLYNTIENEGRKNTVFENVYKIKSSYAKNSNTIGFTDVSHLNEAFRQASLVQVINESDDDTIRNLVESNQILLKKMLDTANSNGYAQYTNLYQLYDNDILLDDDGKEGVYEDLIDSEYSDAEDFWNKFNERVIAQAIYRVNSYGDIEKIIEDGLVKTILSSEIFTSGNALNYSKYDQLKNKGKVWKDIANELYEDYQDICEDFDSAVDTQYDKENGVPSGGGRKTTNRTTNVTISTPQGNATSEYNSVPYLSDLDDSHWASESVKDLAAKGIISGYGDGTFRPNDVVTREQFIKLLVLAFYNVDKTATCSFSDVAANEWYAEHIATAQKLGIASGMGNNLFGVGQKISRQDMVTMAYRVITQLGFQLQDGSEQLSFGDASSISQYALKPVFALQRAGIINGSDNNMFNPYNDSTRAEASIIIFKLLKMVQNVK